MISPPLLTSTSPRPKTDVRPKMDSGAIPRQSDRDEELDGYCLRYAALLDNRRAAKADSTLLMPHGDDLAAARGLCRLALGHKGRRRVRGKLFAMDFTGTIHVSEVIPSQRNMAPYLIRTWKGV